MDRVIGPELDPYCFAYRHRILKRDHPLSSGAKGFAANLAPKYSDPYTVTKVLSPVVYNLRSPSGQKILRGHIKDLKPYRLTVPTFSGCRTHEPHRCQRTCLVPSSSCVDDRPLRMSWPKQPDGPPNGCSYGSEERRRPPQKGKMRTRTPKDVRNAPAPLRTSPTPVGPTASGKTPSLPRTRPAASICRIDGSDRRALPKLTRESRGPATPLDLTVRSRRRGTTPPLPPLPPPRVPDRAQEGRIPGGPDAGGDTSGLGAKTNLPGTSNTPAGRRRVQCTTRDVVPKNFPLVVRPPTDRRTPLRCAVTDPRTSPGLYLVCAIRPWEHIHFKM
ncbi:hypothetical protein GEV33_001019 [Tenebrio molitor]|uniref:Uncharacterized protein n=1 Tax=Tenebrio molitor TaxID=7067 RepID=A0A8J6HWY9_TENMO|nr:hypothetical protein GEV33_001019 [Tenebrio molitor]